MSRSRTGKVRFLIRRTPPLLLLPLFFLPLLSACENSGVSVPETDTPQRYATKGQVFGATDGPGSLTSVSDVAISGDGRVFASQSALAEVLVFETDGSFFGTVGGRGEGPGEFRMPTALSVRGDTLAVTDFFSGISLFGKDGSFAYRISFTLPGPPGVGFPIRPLTLLADGSVACFGPTGSGAALSGAVTHQSWPKASREGVVFDTLIVHPVGEPFVLVEGSGSRPLTFGRPAPSHDLAVLRPDGTELIAVDRSSGGPGLVSVFRINLSGDTVVSRQLEYEPLPVTSTWIDSTSIAMAEGIAGVLTVTPDRFAGSIRDQVPWPEFRSPVAELLAASDGTIWLKGEAPAQDSIRWDILDEALESIGHVYLPVALDVKRVSMASVWGVELDDVDIPWIVRYDIH